MALTVMTYNVGNGLAAPSALVQLLQRGPADVVGLQELTASQANALRTELAAAYPYQVLTPDGFAGKGVLSRYPIVDHEPLLLYPERPDLRVAVAVEDLQLNVLIGHPPPPRLAGTRIRFDPPTVAQLNRLATLALERQPGMLLGDFNMTQRNPMYARFRAAGLLDAFAAAGTGRGWSFPTRLGYAARLDHGLQGLPLRPVARLDYIWCTPGLRAEAAWVGDDGGSDHLPVLARLKLPRG